MSPRGQVGHGDSLQVGGLAITCLYTPCHTAGHICYYVTQVSHCHAASHHALRVRPASLLHAR